MKFDELWLLNWQKYMSYLDANKRRPSKYNVKDRHLVNWLKYNRKMFRKNKLDDARKEKLSILLVEANKYRRVNQHSYYNK